MSTLEREQARAIAESAVTFLSSNAGPTLARRLSDGRDLTLKAVNWREMAALGWIGITCPESSGGLELGAHAACLISEESGRALSLAPLTMGIAAANFLAHSDKSAAVQALDALLSGDVHVALAAPRAPKNSDPDRAFLVAESELASMIIGASGSGSEFEARLFQFTDQGVGIELLRRVDSGSLGHVQVSLETWLNSPLIARGTSGESAWKASQDMFRLADAAYLCGIAAASLTMSLDYLGVRRQFGVQIGTFQALQHRAADCHIQISAGRALVYEATRAFGTARSGFAAAASIRRAAQVALHVAKENVQFHGAIGFAEEHDAGLLLRRALALSAWHSNGALSALRAAKTNDDLRAQTIHAPAW